MIRSSASSSSHNSDPIDYINILDNCHPESLIGLFEQWMHDPVEVEKPNLIACNKMLSSLLREDMFIEIEEFLKK